MPAIGHPQAGLSYTQAACDFPAMCNLAVKSTLSAVLWVRYAPCQMTYAKIK